MPNDIQPGAKVADPVSDALAGEVQRLASRIATELRDLADWVEGRGSAPGKFDAALAIMHRLHTEVPCLPLELLVRAAVQADAYKPTGPVVHGLDAT